MKSKLFKTMAASLLISMSLYTLPVAAFTKDETIYSNLDSNGNAYQKIVTEHLINEEDLELLKDMTDLLNIENTNGEESYKEEGNYIVWDASGKDIYYKGTTENELPVKISIKYYLDDNEITPEELAGKSGKVTIKIEFNNIESHQVRISEKNTTLYTPFVVAFGTIINNENIDNLNISSGKIIDDGTKSTILGFSFPGMKESLNITNNEIDIPEDMEISFETTKFEANNIICYTAPITIKEDLKIFDKIDSIYSKIDSLKEATNKLVDGSKELSEGLTSLDNGVEKLNSGSKELYDGSNQLKDGSKTIKDNMSKFVVGTDSINNGQKQITTGLTSIKNALPSEEENIKNQNTLNYLKSQNTNAKSKLSDANTALEAKLTQIENQKKEAKDKITTIEGQIEAIKTKINQVTTKYNTLNNELESLKAKLNTMTEDDEGYTTLKTSVENLSQTVTLVKSTKDSLEGTLVSLNGNVESINIIIDLLDQTTDSINTSVETNKGLVSLVEGNIAVVDNSINTIDSMRNLNGAISSLETGSKELEDGSTSLVSGAKQLEVGTNQLYNGLVILNAGSKELYNGTSEVKEGTSKLAEGGNTLADGLTQYNDEAIKPIANLINGNLKDKISRLEELKKLADNYSSFTKKDEETKGTVKFITIIDSIKSENNKNQSVEKIGERSGN